MILTKRKLKFLNAAVSLKSQSFKNLVCLFILQIFLMYLYYEAKRHVVRLSDYYNFIILPVHRIPAPLCTYIQLASSPSDKFTSPDNIPTQYISNISTARHTHTLRVKSFAKHGFLQHNSIHINVKLNEFISIRYGTCVNYPHYIHQHSCVTHATRYGHILNTCCGSQYQRKSHVKVTLLTYFMLGFQLYLSYVSFGGLCLFYVLRKGP